MGTEGDGNVASHSHTSLIHTATKLTGVLRGFQRKPE